MNKKLIFIPLFVFLSGCVSLNSVSLTPIPAERNKPIKIEKDKVIILGLNFDNDFVDSLVDELKARCPQGQVTGLLTKDEDVNYFLFFVWKKRVTVQGYCVAKKETTQNSGSKRKTASEEEIIQPTTDIGSELSP